MDISNGKGIGVALFVQGCHFHCKNCFNSDTWDFSGGKEWTKETKENFLSLMNKPQIKRVSILGGEPLAEENLDSVLDLVNETRLIFPEKTIWLYSGYIWEEIFDATEGITTQNLNVNRLIRQQIIKQCDIMIDGKFIDSQKDLSLKWRGSKNQRCISIDKSLKMNTVVEL